MRRGRSGSLYLVLATAVLLSSRISLVAAQNATTSKTAATPPSRGRVSIYDGVLPSPDLGPQPERAEVKTQLTVLAPVPAPALATAPMRAPVPAPAPMPQPVAVLAPAPSPTPSVVITSSSGLHCGAGCIAGSVVGGVVLLVLLPLLLCLCWCFRRRSINDEVMSTATDMELLSHPVRPARDLSIPPFRVGDDVFCNEGRNCSFGRITEVLKDDKYEVAMWDGDTREVHGSMLARNYPEGTQVVYSPPDGRRPQVTGTIIQADGSYWPPFYQLTPHSGHLSLVNTTAECIQELLEDAKAGQGEHYISAKAI